MSSAGAVSAGIASLMRKAATPARTSRMKMPEPLALPAKMRSPGRRTARCVAGGSVGAFVAVTAAPWELFGPSRGPVSAGGGDGVDSALGLLTESVRDGGVAGILGGRLLAGLAD